MELLPSFQISTEVITILIKKKSFAFNGAPLILPGCGCAADVSYSSIMFRHADSKQHHKFKKVENICLGGKKNVII